MPNRSVFHRLLTPIITLSFLTIAGCEGVARRHDKRVGEIKPPSLEANYTKGDLPNFPDHVENMLAVRLAYINQLISLERGYLMAGDTVRANWARRQRELTENVEVYPYLTAAAPEESVEVSPEERIPEADALYSRGVELVDKFDSVPFGGLLKPNKKKARQALGYFKQVLREYPKSDKVDDCAFYCGDIYKEYLRDDDPDNELALRYYKWAYTLDPVTPHPARFHSAVVYDFRLHNREKAIELYHQVLETEEASNESNQRFSATRIEQLSDDDGSHLRPREPDLASEPRREPRVPVTANLNEK
ncbi:MAG: hypothetical protein MI923_02850 [Phycisphaerales bacterium]|nr:hypothetical protein [Phycisphaerales bacterium]